MPILVAILLGALALAFVLFPLYRRGQHVLAPAPGARSVTIEGLPTEREQATRNALQEVELDYQLGNISETDYRGLRERYVQRALVALKSRYDREQELDELIEEQLRTLKEQSTDAKE